MDEQPSCCVLCQDVLKDPVSTSCGHWFCRQCISSYWDQSAPPGDSSCPQCGLQTASQSITEQSKNEHLSAVIMSENRTLCFITGTFVVSGSKFEYYYENHRFKNSLIHQDSHFSLRIFFFSFSRCWSAGGFR